MSASVGYLTYPLCGRGSKESPDVAEALSLPKLEKRGLSKGLKSYDKAGGWNFLLAGHRRQCIRDIRENKLGFSPNRNCWGPLLRRKKERAWCRGVWMGGTRLWSWGPAEFGWVASGFGAGGPRSLDVGWVARGSGAGGPRSLDGWHAAFPAALDGCGPQMDGWHASWEPADFGWLARGSGLRSMGARNWVARGFGAGGLDGGTALGLGPAEFRWVSVGPWTVEGRHVAQERSWGFGWVARGSGGGPRSLEWLRSWGPVAGGTRLGAGAGARGLLDGWHAGLDGWRAAGTVCLDGRHMAQSWGPAWGLDGRSLDGWHAALEQGARGFDACAGHF